MARQSGSVLTALALGAGLMFFLDPQRGRSRRARVRDQLSHAARAGGDALGATSRDVAHRTAGAAARMRGRLRHEPVDDAVLVERVRAQLGRAVSHPRAIDVRAEKGVVTLTGPVLAAEVPRLVRSIERVRGVREVIAALDEHETSENIPALQGGARRDASAASRLAAGAWSPAARLLAGTTGMTLTGVGASRGGPSGALLALAGVGLIAQAALSPRSSPERAALESRVNA